MESYMCDWSAVQLCKKSKVAVACDFAVRQPRHSCTGGAQACLVIPQIAHIVSAAWLRRD